jgi:predicted nucleic acid-binding protein
MGPARARAIVTDLMNDPMFEWRDVSGELVTAAVSSWLERFRDQRFSLADAVSFEVMSQDRLEQAFAFGRHFRTAGFYVIP